MGCRK